MHKILIVDDTKTNLMVHALMLYEQGFEKNVETFSSAEEMLDYLGIDPRIENANGIGNENEKKEISLILLDLQMPTMSGYEACKIIRMDEQYKDTPIIITTGVQVTRNEVRKNGATDCLIKPVSYEDLQLLTNKYCLQG